MEASEAGAHAAAGEKFELVVSMVPESSANRALRESAALNVVEEWTSVYEEGVSSGSEDTSPLERAIAFRDLYLREFHAAYGPNAAIIHELTVAFNQLELRLKEARTVAVLHCLQPCLSPIPPNERGCGSNDPGMALTLLLPLGLRRRRDVFDRIADALPADVAAKVRSKLDNDD